MAFIIVGVLAELSIAKLFIAGILPGILSVFLFSIMIFTRCYINPDLAPTGVSFSWKERFLSLRKAWGILLIFVIVIGGLYTGMATILETAALGCLVALTMVVLNIFNKRCTWRDLWGAVMDSIVISSMIFAFFICAGVLGLFVTISDIVAGAVNIVEVLDVPPMAVVVAFLFILLIMGCFLDTTSVIMISVPLFFPILVGGLNVDPIWFSVITVIMVEVAALTPPIGMALFYMKGIYPDATLEEIIRGSSWFVAMNLLVVILLLIFPKIATFLLDTMW
jgi:tripartite ATP-independent transporter DctM subunit